MKKIWKWTAAAMAVGICACNFAVPSVLAKTEDSSSNAYLCDEGDFLSDSEFQKAMDELQATADETGMNVAVWIGSTQIGDGSDEDTVAFCDDHYDELYGINTDGVFLYLDMSDEYSLYDYLSTSGKGQFYYTNSEDYNRVGTIISEVEEELPRGEEDLPSAVHVFCHDLKYYYEAGAPGNVYPGTSASTDTVFLCDEGNNLNSEEFQKVFSEMQSTSDEIGMNVAVWIGSTQIGDGSDEDTVAFCDDHYDELYGINTDGVFLYLDMSDEYSLYDYLSTSGKGQFYYTNSEDYNRVGTIISEVEEELPRGEEDLPSAVHVFCHDLEYYYQSGVPSDTYYVYNADTGKYQYLENGTLKEAKKLPEEYTAVCSWGTIVIFSVLIGLIAGGISLLSIRNRYKFKTAGSMQNYLVANEVQYRKRTDQFLRTYTTRTKISSESSGGGGGGGGSSHSSSSGGSHGGGGGHR